jgi:SAM-dependent methyltransferase
MARTGLPDESLDAALSVDAPFYVADLLAALRETARVLRPGARFIFTLFEIDPIQAAQRPVGSRSR